MHFICKTFIHLEGLVEQHSGDVLTLAVRGFPISLHVAQHPREIRAYTRSTRDANAGRAEQRSLLRATLRYHAALSSRR